MRKPTIIVIFLSSASRFAKSIAYDLAGQTIAETNALGHTFTSGFSSTGKVNLTTDPLGYLHTTLYDSCDRPLVLFDANARKLTLTYDAAGRETGRSYTDGTKLTVMYDSLSRITTQISANWLNTYAYDSRGLLANSVEFANTSSYLRDPSGNVIQSTSGSWIATNTYDPLCRLSTSQDLSGSQFTLAYDSAGRKVQQTWNSGQISTLAYDAGGRQTSQLDFGVLNAACWTMAYGFDARDNCLVDNRNGLVTTNSYNAVGAKALINSAHINATLVYDGLFGLVSAQVLGQSDYSAHFDARGKLTSDSQSGPASTYTYDEVGNRTLIQSGLFLTTYTYDGENRPLITYNPDGTIITNLY